MRLKHLRLAAPGLGRCGLGYRKPTWPTGFLEDVVLMALLREEWAKLSQK